MARSRLVRLLLGVGVLASSAVPTLTGTAGPAAQAASCPWMSTHKSADERARELVHAMTLDQKVAELYGRGDFTHYGTANDIPAVPALCIPELVFNDAGAGVGDGVLGTTAFPDGITQAASWDRDMQHRVGAAIGWEAWHKGIDVQLAPGVDIARSPLGGRNFEYAGEDPYLSGQTGVSEIQGIQSQHVAATVKHYALNDQETNRMTDSSDADPRTMEEIHLPAFEGRGEAGARRVGDVLLQPHQRPVRVRERLPAQPRAQGTVPFPGLGDVRLGRHALDRQVGEERPGPGAEHHLGHLLLRRAEDRRAAGQGVEEAAGRHGLPADAEPVRRRRLRQPAAGVPAGGAGVRRHTAGTGNRAGSSRGRRGAAQKTPAARCRSAAPASASR